MSTDPAPDPDRGAARAGARDGHRLLRGKRARTPREAPRARRARGRGRQLLRARSRSTPTTSWASSRSAFNEMQHRLARLDTARKEFIANASHELRTPIFSLGGFVELLQDEDLDEDTRAEFLDHDARAGGPPAEAHHRPARPLPARRRLDRPGAGAGAAAHAREPGGGRVRGRRGAQGRRDRGRRPRVAGRHRGRLRPRARGADRARADRQCARAHAGRHHASRSSAGRGSAPGSPRHRAELLVTDDGPGHPPPRPGARVRALPHQRLGPGLGPRTRNRARAGPANARRPRGHLEARHHDLHAHAPARRRARAAGAAGRARRRSRRAPRCAHDAPGRHRAAGVARRS